MVRDYAKQQRYTFMGTDQGPPGEGGRPRHRPVPGAQPYARLLRQPAGSSRARPRGPPPGGSRAARQAATATRPRPLLPCLPRRRPAAVRAPHPRASGPAAAPQPGGRTRHWIEINGTRHQISRPTLVLGRSTEADVRIDDPGVSRRHCEIRTGTPSTVQDLGSTNGIVVDGQHTTRATLRDGSRIVVGSTTIIYRQAEG